MPCERPQFITAIALGIAGAGLDLDRLAALLAASPAGQPPRHIGAADVAAVEQLTTVLRDWDFSRGGGAARSAAVAQFQAVLSLRHATCAAAVRQRLLVATADLGTVAAFSAYDMEHHDQARRLWAIALGVAREADHPDAADLTANLLLDVAHQAMRLDRPQEALSVVQVGYGAGASRGHPLSEATASRLKVYEAWFQAARADARSWDRAKGQAVEHFTQVEPVASAPWATHISAGELTAVQGQSFLTLALTTGEVKHAGRAVPLLQQAVNGFEAGYARSRAINLPGLAGAHVLAGDLQAGVQVGHRAVEEITALASPRIYHRLRTLDTVLAPQAAEPGVRELRGRI